jgi:hypothetical protein
VPVSTEEPVRVADPAADRWSPVRSAAAGVATAALVAVLLDVAVDVLPDDALVGIVTPTRLLVGVGLVAVALAGHRWGRWWREPLSVTASALVLAAALATATSGQTWAGWRGVLTQVALFALAYGVGALGGAAVAPLGLLGLIAVAVPAGVGLQQSVSRTPTGFCRGSLSDSADVCGPDSLVRAVGTFTNPNLLAAFLVLVLPLAVLGALRLADRDSRLVGAAVVLTGYAAVVATGSRAALLAAAAGGAVLVLARCGTAVRVRVAAVLGLGLAGLVAVFALAAGGSAGIRADVWDSAAESLAGNPLGVGLGRAGAVISERMPGGEPVQHAHNLWLNWAVEAGYPGLLAIVALTVAVVVTLRRVRCGSGFATASTAGLLGLATMCLVDHPTNSLRVASAVWVVLGLLAARAEPGPRTV